MQRRQFLLSLIGIGAGSAVLAALPSAQALAGPPELDRVLAAAPEGDAEYSLLVGRLTHRRRAGGWWRMRVARARAWGRRERPGRR
ncbi:hypothetical protein SAMN05428997_101284 [Bosea sp. CRIB-10]|uniref:hypothetical protein n=1 Tax=Bosea sp. CRIB-10 TaxID=378404 RepID=UPI0008EDA101|nr:hypothetical protein [Bosea sp. CRIB-10]SFB68945.1 hypothetical protein SAMN05428997_101284 [Bosea sp. CRIB-10]